MKVDISIGKVRIRGEKGSAHNQLRYELYTEAFNRIEKGLQNGRYFEVIALDKSTSV